MSKKISNELADELLTLNEYIHTLANMAFKYIERPNSEMVMILNILDQQTTLINREIEDAEIIWSNENEEK